MENSGCSFDVEYHKPEQYKETCGTNNTWYGFSKRGSGKITATFTGLGTATLDYGYCSKGHSYLRYVTVSLNGKEIDKATRSTASKQITFRFLATDVLLLKGTNGAIIKLNSLKLTCKGKIFFLA